MSGLPSRIAYHLSICTLLGFVLWGGPGFAASAAAQDEVPSESVPVAEQPVSKSESTATTTHEGSEAEKAEQEDAEASQPSSQQSTPESDDAKSAAAGAESQAKGEAPSEVTLNGFLQATQTLAVQVSPQEWSTLTVKEAVQHGQTVQAGDTLILLETDDLQQAMTDLAAEIELDELALADARIKLDLAERSQNQALAVSARADREAAEDLKEYLTGGRQRREQSMERSVKSAEDRLAYQEEELHQLEKMYAADDLTEETEEIILKRTRDAVESARYSLQVAKDSQRRGVEFDLPRNEQDLETAVTRAALALVEARGLAPQSLQRQQLQFKKQQRELEQKRTRLAGLKDDLERMEVTAPTSGVVYFGHELRGKWSDGAASESMLRAGGTLKPKSTVLTLVQPRPLVVRAAVPEESVRHLVPGKKVRISTLAYPEMELTGTVSDVAKIPFADGSFDATVALDNLPDQGRLVAGMKAEIHVSQDDTQPSKSPGE